MFRHRRKHLRQFLVHRLPAALVLVAYLIALFGVHVSSSAGKDHRVPFPCQDHLCGCCNADDCWRHCCCFSVEERLAWARTHGVEPPAYAVQPGGQGWHSVRLRDHAEAKPTHACAHCDHRETPQADDAHAPKPCCARDGETRTCSHQSSRAPAAGCWGLSFRALRCQGLHSWWISTPSLMPPPARLTWTSFPVCTGWLADREVTGLARWSTPPDPPPRALFT